MNAIEDLVSDLRRRINSRSSASFFMNGGPGTGKSYALRTLIAEIPNAIPGSFVLHSQVNTQADREQLVGLQMRQCHEAGYLDTLPPGPTCTSLDQAWCWVASHGALPRNGVFVVLIDVAESASSLSHLASLLSSARYMETAWRGNGRLLSLVTGSWDSAALMEYYQQTGTSFPYTEGHNYVVWDGITRDDVIRLLPGEAPEARMLHAGILHETTGGNPAVIQEILAALPDGILSLDAILKATATVAEQGAIAGRLLDAWRQLLPESQHLIYQLLTSRAALRTGMQQGAGQLLTLGVVREEIVGGTRYVVLRSWYHELLFRKHLPELGYADSAAAKVQVSELMPGLQIVNREAYQVILEVENAVRSHFVLRSQIQDKPGASPLQERLVCYDEEVGIENDASQRAAHLRDRSAAAGLPTNLNPLIAYCSTRDLASLVDTLTDDTARKTWRRIGRTLRRLVPVRNAVMHNQLIDEAALLRLYALRAEVYEAMAPTGGGSP